jgi:molybdopterin-guanine dinucleotide biosynthesis protein
VLVVVGGHSRNIGKTSVVAGIIRQLREARWTALKITQYGHGVCGNTGEACRCRTDPAHPFQISEEFERNGSDSGRFLEAGAVRSYWLRTAVGQLGHAVETIRRIIGESEHTIVESNSLLHFFRPDLYLVVLHYDVEDWKDSARLYVQRADALVESGGDASRTLWRGVPAQWLENKPVFAVSPPEFVTPELISFVARRLGLRQAHGENRLPSGTAVEAENSSG